MGNYSSCHFRILILLVLDIGFEVTSICYHIDAQVFQSQCPLQEILQKDFGIKTGDMLWHYSRGIDNRLVGLIQV